MSDYLKELAKGVIAFANLFAVLVFFKTDHWFYGILAILTLYITSGALFYVASSLKVKE